MNIIGITGKAGSGKDTIANYLSNKYAKTWKESFAKPLKLACAAAFGIDIEDFNDSEIKELTNNYWGVSPRQIAQFVGTEMFRDMIGKLLESDHNSFWVTRMAGLLDGYIPTEDGAIYDDEDTILIPDVRFQNEYEFITARDGIILQVVKSDVQEVGISGHASEAGIKTSSENTWLILNDGTLEELYEEVEKALTAFNVKLFINTLVPRNSDV